MKYCLVLQWPASSIDDYDAMIEAEDALIRGLGEGNEVDGHDAGSSEVNIFIRTDDPKQAFRQLEAILRSRGSWDAVRIAYREVNASQYTVLWPKGLTRFDVT